MNWAAFYFNTVGGIPLSVQKEAARADGWDERFAATYEETRNSYPRERNKCIGDLRKGKGDGVWVYAFVCIAPRKRDLPRVRKALDKVGAHIYEGKTGWTTKGKRYGDILEHSIKYWSRGRLTHDQAVVFGREGGIAVKKPRTPANRMPVIDALKIWRNAHWETWREALDEINADERYEPYDSKSTADRLLGRRNLPTGPRPRRK